MGRMVKEPVWVADDGSRFNTENEMLAHEGALRYSEHIEEYMATFDFKDMHPKSVQAQKTRIRSIVLAYLAWADGDDGEKAEGAVAVA